jgi:hypothetical protein
MTNGEKQNLQLKRIRFLTKALRAKSLAIFGCQWFYITKLSSIKLRSMSHGKKRLS